MSENKPPFKNPVLTTDPSRTLRSTLVVKSSVDARIKAIYPKSGVLQTTINLLLDKLCYELDRCELNEYDPAAYERAITDAEIRIGGFTGPGGVYGPNPSERSTTSVVTAGVGLTQSSQANHGDDGPGTLGLVSDPTGASVVVSDDGRTSKGRRSKGNKGEKSA